MQPWEKDTVVEPAQRGTVFRDPYRPREEERKDVATEIDRERLRVSQEAEARQRATLPADIKKAEADAVVAEAKAREADLASKKLETSRIQAALQTDSVLGAINTARRQIGEGWATGNVFGTKTFQGVPVAGQGSTNLAATISGLQGSIINDTIMQLKALSASGASGYGALSETEATRLAAAVGALQQTQDAKSLLENLAKVEKHYRNSLALLNNEDPRIPEVARKYGIAGDKAPPAGGSLTSEGRFEDDPALRGVNSAVEQMIRQGASEEAVRGYLNTLRPGLGDQSLNIRENIESWRQNPDAKINVDIEKKWEPATGFSRMLGDIGMSPVGAALIGAGDTASLGMMDQLFGNPAEARAVMEGVSLENPTSYLLGQIGGGVSTGLGMESLAARGGLSGLRAARAADVAYGAGYGAGSADEPDDSRITSALLGGATGLAGGVAGQAAARGVGRAATGINDITRRALDRAGVRMTPGQVFGGAAQRTEDRLSGLPFVGEAINARRAEGIEDFNRAAFDEALAPIGATTGGRTGHVGAQAAHDATGKAYRNALGGSEVFPDQQFEADLAQAVGNLRSVPRIGGEVTDEVSRIVNPEYFTGQGSLTGENMQPMLQELRRLRAAYRNDPLGNRVGEAISDIEAAIAGMFERQAIEVMPAYRAADQAYRNVSVLDDAVNKALNQTGTFMPSQLGAAARSNTTRYGGKRAAAEGNMPFFDLQQAGQEVLPSKIPDSGTAGRMILPLLAGSAVGGGTYVTQEGEPVDRASSGLLNASIVAALLSAPYSRAGSDVIQRAMMAERPLALTRAGEVLTDNARIAGLLARPAAVGYVTD